MNTFLEQAFGKKDATTPKMRTAIRDWAQLYYGAPRPGEDDAERLPVLIVSKLCRTVFAEYTARVLPTGQKAAWMRGNLAALDAIRKAALQAALVGGECLLKPVPHGAGFDFVPIRRECYLPLSRDLHGNLLAVASMEVLRQGGKRYALLERRTAGKDENLRIETRLFELVGDALGREVTLDTLPQTAALQPTLLLPGVPGVGLAVLHAPLLNCVDGSPDGVAVFAPAVGLLHALARNQHQLNKEFENGASRVFASEDLLREDGYGRRALRDELFVGLPDDPANVGVTVYSPALREASYLARKQDILRSCESLIGLKRGILSEVEASERTATEITSSQGDYSLTIEDFQGMWADGVAQTLTLCDALGRVYGLCDTAAFDPAADVVLEWGDGVLCDREKLWQEQERMVAAGMLRPELALAWYFDLPHETEGDLEVIRKRYMPKGE